MTQLFLIYFPNADEYFITSMGKGRRFQKIIRKDGWTDDEFRDEATKQFQKLTNDILAPTGKYAVQEIISEKYIY